MVFFVSESDSVNSPNISIPPGAVAGDTLLALVYGPNVTVTDPRFTKVADLPDGGDDRVVWTSADAATWVAVYDGDPTPVAYSYSAVNAGVLLAAYRTPNPGVTGSLTFAGLASPTSVPQLGQSTRAVLAVVTTSGVVDSLAVTPSFTKDAGYGGGLPKIELSFHSWEGPLGLTPGTTVTAGGDDPRFHAVLMRLNPIASAAPPCRLTGRGDVHDFGGGRLHPFAPTQQGGSRTSGTY